MINRYVLSSCAAAALSLGVATAQTAPQTPTQSPVQGSTQGITGQSRPTTGVANATTVTISGCVMRAADYTRAQGGATAGAGSVSSGASAGDDFVLSHAAMGSATRSSAEAPGSGEVAAGVSGSTSAGRDSAAVGTSGAGARAGGSISAGNPGARNDASPDSPDPNANVGNTNNPNATASAPGAQSAAGRQTTGTSGAAASLGTVYTLSGSREAELAQHVGKRLEVTGTLDRAGAAAATSGSTRPGASPSTMPELTITSYRVMPGNCQ
jgi:hypothetical protein